MSKQHEPSGERIERLEPKLYQELGKAGWRIPQAEHEVRAAEDWVSRSPDRVPARLDQLPGEDGHQKGRGVLDHYIQDEGRVSSVDESNSKDVDRSGPDLERD